MARAVALQVNPADKTQYYVLWDNGKIDRYGTAPAITSQPTWFDWVGPGPGRAFQITDWSTGAGYVLDFYGVTHALNGAPGTSGGSVAPFAVYVDFMVDPAGSGKGYRLRADGLVDAFGGAAAAPASDSFPGLLGRSFHFHWAQPTPGWVTIDGWGGLHRHGSLGSMPITGAPYWKGWNIARRVRFYDETNGKGWVLDGWGGLHSVGGAQVIPNGPTWHGWDIATDFAIVNDGTGADPLEVYVLDGLGAVHRVIASTKPTVTIQTPADASTVTDTTRPDLTWAYDDPEGDAQYEWELAVYTTTQADPFGTAAVAGAVIHEDQVSRNVRGFTPVDDLDNGTYELYVRAKDTSQLWSDADHVSWTQDVTLPAAASVSAEVLGGAIDGILISGTISSPAAGDFVSISWVEEGGATGYVRDAGRIDASGGSFSVVDYEAKIGKTRLYFANRFREDPFLQVSTAAFDAYATLPVEDQWLFTSTADPTLGGAFRIVEPFSFSRAARAGVFGGVGRQFPVVVSDGVLKAATAELNVVLLSADDYTRMIDLLESDSTLLLRDSFSRAWYCRVVGSVDLDFLRAAATEAETTKLRHSHTVRIPLVEVESPSVVAPTDLTISDPDTTIDYV